MTNTIYGLNAYTDNGITLIKKAKIVPDEMLEFKDDSIKKINNVFGGDVALIAWRDKISFVIDLTDIPQDACVELLTQNWTPSHAYALAITTNVYSLSRLSGALTDIGYKSCNFY
ncbi:MAG: hypothetical protein IJ525_01850 [Alphaproteobacteria bacterium]|nr:hypothetical protein [Alphaproteobacteria bacterium]